MCVCVSCVCVVLVVVVVMVCVCGGGANLDTPTLCLNSYYTPNSNGNCLFDNPTYPVKYRHPLQLDKIQITDLGLYINILIHVHTCFHILFTCLLLSQYTHLDTGVHEAQHAHYRMGIHNIIMGYTYLDLRISGLQRNKVD